VNPIQVLGIQFARVLQVNMRFQYFHNAASGVKTSRSCR
jgi:hypothetical protein